MILKPQIFSEVRRNHFETPINPEEHFLSASRFSSPCLKLGQIKSWKFIYTSPSRVQHAKCEGPLAFNKHCHKLTVRKLPTFHQQIFQNESLKNSKIIENINFIRQHEKRKLRLGDSQMSVLERSRVSNKQFQIKRELVELRSSRHQDQLKMSRSLSCSYNRLEDSRFSVIEGLKSSESLYQSIAKQQGTMMKSRVLQVKKDQGKINLAESKYFEGIIGK